MQNHIRKGANPSNGISLAWCGTKISEGDWYFRDTDHLILMIERKSNIKPCKNCLGLIKKIFENVHLN